MPILIDVSQVIISNLMKSPDIRKGYVDSNLIKHMVLNSIRSYKQKFHLEYGEVVICCDSGDVWRKDIFPHYKASRKSSRDNSSFDWKEIFTTIGEVKRELKEFFPYKVIAIDRCEADDIVAVIAMNETRPTMIVGGDKDYAQLHVYPHVKQYSPALKKYITIDNPKETLMEHIIRGDKGDGVPNIKSDSDSFVSGKRQKSILAKDVERWIRADDPKLFCENRQMLENFERNKSLIDFRYIPQNLVEQILAEYAKEPLGSKSKMIQYFMANKMRNLMAEADQF